METESALGLLAIGEGFCLLHRRTQVAFWVQRLVNFRRGQHLAYLAVCEEDVAERFLLDFADYRELSQMLVGLLAVEAFASQCHHD